MGSGQMLRVTKVEEWLRRAPLRPNLMSTRAACLVIRAGDMTAGRTVSGVTPHDLRSLPTRVVMIPPGTRGMPHFHADHEYAIYTVNGETEIWHGDGLVKRTVIRAGDFMYVPPGTPHLAVNRGDALAITVVASTDPEERESVVVVELPRHLADVVSLPVAAGSTP